MSKTKSLKLATEINWRYFKDTAYFTDRLTGGEYRYRRNIGIESVCVQGFCVLYEKKTKGKIGLRVDLDNYDIPNADIYICVECTDFQNRNFYIITTPTVDKYLLSLYTSGTIYVFDSSDTIYASSPRPFDIDRIGVDDREFLRMAIDIWADKLN